MVDIIQALLEYAMDQTLNSTKDSPNQFFHPSHWQRKLMLYNALQKNVNRHSLTVQVSVKCRESIQQHNQLIARNNSDKMWFEFATGSILIHETLFWLNQIVRCLFIYNHFIQTQINWWKEHTSLFYFLFAVSEYSIHEKSSQI